MKLFSLFSVLGLALGDLKAFIGKQAPDFTAQAVVNGQFEKLSLSDYRGKYVVFFFYPLDFTFVCPTEIIAFRWVIGTQTDPGPTCRDLKVDGKWTWNLAKIIF